MTARVRESNAALNPESSINPHLHQRHFYVSFIIAQATHTSVRYISPSQN